MTLRLSTPSTASGSASSGIDVYMQRLLDDTSISLSQKNDCVSYKKSSLYLKRLVQELATLLCSALLYSAVAVAVVIVVRRIRIRFVLCIRRR